MYMCGYRHVRTMVSVWRSEGNSGESALTFPLFLRQGLSFLHCVIFSRIAGPRASGWFCVPTFHYGSTGITDGQYYLLLISDFLEFKCSFNQYLPSIVHKADTVVDSWCAKFTKPLSSWALSF